LLRFHFGFLLVFATNARGAAKRHASTQDYRIQQYTPQAFTKRRQGIGASIAADTGGLRESLTNSTTSPF
jgi:hypothetical protein